MEVKQENITQEETLEQGVKKEGQIFLNENGEVEGDLGWDIAVEEEPQPKEEPAGDEEDAVEETAEPEAVETPEESVTAEEEDVSQEPAKKEEIKKTQNEEVRFYTPEELMDTSLDKIDPNRLPPALQKIYKSMQADYTRKTQQAAQLRKAAESIINQTISKPLTELPKDVVEQITKQADLIVKQQLGEDADEFDSNYIAIKATIVQELANNYKKQVQTQEILQRTEQMLRASEPFYETIEKIALDMIPNLPYAKVQEIEYAKSTGNPEPLIQLFEEARKVFYSQQLAGQAQQHYSKQPQQTQQQQKPIVKKPAPPAVESGGQLNLDETSKKPKIKPKDLAGQNVDTQAEMLIKLGLVDF